VAVLKYHDGTGWEPVVSALQGPTGDAGAVYQDNEPTDTGVLWVDTDDDGFLVVPNGGATGAVLTKQSSADYDTGWDLPVNSGLVHINTTTFSAVATQAVSDVFSATYDDYLILTKVTPSTNSQIHFQLRTGSTDLTANYRVQTHRRTGGSTSGESNTGYNGIYALDGTTEPVVSQLYLFDPFQTVSTKYLTTAGSYSTNGFLTGNTLSTTSYESIKILGSAGTITGSISIFGVAK
jgi:hypothetical protein